MKKNLLVFLLGMAPLVGSAEVVSEEQAYDAAVRFFQNTQNRFSRSGVLPVKLIWNGLSKQSRSAHKDAPFYVFSRGTNQGFVIVAGDNAVSPVLGYSDQGSFVVSELPEALREWFDEVAQKISEVRRLDSQPSPAVSNQWKTLSWGTPVVLLDTPKWDQEAPYNAYLPGFDGWHGYVGCTMTATAIVLGYHQWPDCGEGVLKGYYTSGLGVEVPGVTLGHPYLWDKMPGINNNEFASKGTPEYAVQEDAISTLTRDLGVMFKARYDFDGTSAALEKVPLQLVRHMKYHEGIMHLKEENFSEQVWQGILKDELDKQRPIVFAGYKADGSEGHSIVLEGYDQMGLFAINWGWSGRYNGFYNLESLRVGAAGPEITGGGYSTQQEAIIHIQPNRPEQIQQVDQMVFTRKAIGGSTAGMGLHVTEAPASYEKGSQLTISVGAFMNFSSYYIDSPVHLAVTDAEGKVKSTLYTSRSRCYLSPGSLTMPFYDERDFITVTLDQEVAAGDRIRLFFHRQDGAMVPVTTLETDIPWEIVLKEAEQPGAAIDVKTTAGQNLDGRAVATFSSEVPTTPSDAAVEAFYAEQKDANTVVLKKIEATDGTLVVPAHTGVVLATQGAQTLSMQTTTQVPTYVPNSNLLRPTSAQGTVVAPGVNAFILAKKADEVLFHVLSEEDRKIAANHAYLELPSGMNMNSLRMVFEGETTGIENHSTEMDENGPIFDLSGRRVTQATKGGVYIRNGKKYIIK